MTEGGGGGGAAERVTPLNSPPPPAERVTHINSPTPRFGPFVKAYFLVHVRSLHLFTIPFVLVSNFPFLLTLTK